MTTYYVNINTAYTTSGDGSQGNQFKLEQFLTHVRNGGVVSGDIYLFQGKRTILGSELYLTAQGGYGYGYGYGPYDLVIGGSTDFTIDAQDVTSPWILKTTNGVSVKLADSSIGDTHYLPRNMRNGIIDANGAVTQYGSPVGPCNLRTMYMKQAGASDMQFKGNMDIRGCTMVAANASVDLGGGNSGETLTVTDSVVISNGIVIGVDTSPHGVVTNNVFSSNPAYYVGNTPGSVDGTNQTNWTPATAMPGADSLASAFAEQTIAPDGGANDITATASGTFTGDAKGLFGGADRTSSHGIGAFNFGSSVPAPLRTTVNTRDIRDLNVTTAKLADAVVTNAKLASDAVHTANILDLNVTTGKLADAAVTNAKLANDAVQTANILDLNVTTGKLADNAVTSAKMSTLLSGSSLVNEPAVQYTRPVLTLDAAGRVTAVHQASEADLGALFADNFVFSQDLTDQVDGIVTALNVAITAGKALTVGTLCVFKNGIRMRAGGNDYTLNATDATAPVITFVDAPEVGDVVMVDYIQALV